MKYNQVGILICSYYGYFPGKCGKRGDKKYYHGNHHRDANMLCNLQCPGFASGLRLTDWMLLTAEREVKNAAPRGPAAGEAGRVCWAALLVSVLFGSICIITNITTQI